MRETIPHVNLRDCVHVTGCNAVYAKRRKINPLGASIVAASIEAGGRWHPALLAQLKRFIKSAYPDDKKLFVYHLKASPQRVSVELRRPTSDADLVFYQNAKVYLPSYWGASWPPCWRAPRRPPRAMTRRGGEEAL